jgi:8-oxo-dGTP pyrophosphatase MutT (NUDIX family)
MEGVECRAARDGEPFEVGASKGHWQVSWHPPTDPLDGTPHGACGFCITSDRDVVLISPDGRTWDWPGGRPEGDESWEAVFHREVLEEACATVREAELLGFCRSECVSGDESGLVLVRSVWRGDVDLLPWAPQFEIVQRRLVAAADIFSHLNLAAGWTPIYRRAAVEAGLA